MGPRPNLSYEHKGYTPQWGWRVVRAKLEALDADGRIEWSKSGRPYLKRYLHEQKGTPIKSVITDIQPIGAQAKYKHRNHAECEPIIESTFAGHRLHC